MLILLLHKKSVVSKTICIITSCSSSFVIEGEGEEAGGGGVTVCWLECPRMKGKRRRGSKNGGIDCEIEHHRRGPACRIVDKDSCNLANHARLVLVQGFTF